jgi:hypothetical protein
MVLRWPPEVCYNCYEVAKFAEKIEGRQRPLAGGRVEVHGVCLRGAWPGLLKFHAKNNFPTWSETDEGSSRLA